MTRIFGTDGIRGIVGEDLTIEMARSLGGAAVVALGHHGIGRPAVVIGRDTRGSGEALEAAISEGIRAAGGDALLAGVQTTPAIAFLTTDAGASAGVVISASHNPPEYNGIKLFGSTGYKLPDDIEDEIEALMSAPPQSLDGPGVEKVLEDGTERYVSHLVASAPSRLDGMELVVDCANGSASGVSPEALRRLGADVHAVFDAPDGSNINDGCGALHPEVVASEVVARGADAGIAHDGDADRALFADPTGEVIDGDQVLAACAIAAKERGTLAANTVVSTVMANLGFRRCMSDAGIEVAEAKVGDRYVLEEMARTGARLGGEQSGHIIFADHSTTGDGILTAIHFLSLSAREGVPVRDLASCMKRFPQVLVNVRVGGRTALDEASGVWEAVRSSEAELGDRGRVLVRASGTEPLVRVMVEAETEEEARRHAEAIAERVRVTLA